MNKNELITAMSEASGLPKKDCEIALNAFTGVVENALKAEDKVQLVGFGSEGRDPGKRFGGVRKCGEN